MALAFTVLMSCLTLMLWMFYAEWADDRDDCDEDDEGDCSRACVWYVILSYCCYVVGLSCSCTCCSCVEIWCDTARCRCCLPAAVALLHIGGLWWLDTCMICRLPWKVSDVVLWLATVINGAGELNRLRFRSGPAFWIWWHVRVQKNIDLDSYDPDMVTCRC